MQETIFTISNRDPIKWRVERTREIPAFGGISLALRGNGAFGGDKTKEKFWGATAAPLPGAAAFAAFGGDNKLKNKNLGRMRRPKFRGATRIPNIYLVLKLDNGNVVSIANGQNHRDRITDPHSTVLVYRLQNWACTCTKRKLLLCRI